MQDALYKEECDHFEQMQSDSSSITSVTSSNGKQSHTADSIFLKNFTGVLNKRGYNLEEFNTSFIQNDINEHSISSTASNVSSIVAGLKEPHHGQSPLHIASRKGDTQIIKALCRSECIQQLIHLTDNNGNLALHFAVAASKRSSKIVQMLIDAGSPIQAKNNRGLTPIAVHILTIRADDIKILMMLLENGADPNTKIESSTLLHRAVQQDYSCVAAVLVKYGAKYTVIDQSGKMPVELATKYTTRAMLQNISSVQPLLTQERRNECIGCARPLFTNFALASIFVCRLLGISIPFRYRNCYRCGLLYCTKCLRYRNVADSLPSYLLRSKIDDLSKIQICQTCDSILRDQNRLR